MMSWVLIGARIAKAVIVGANAVEGAATTLKGDQKRDLALRVAADAMAICGGTLTATTPEVRDALAAYNDAYVKLQNALAKAEGK